MNVVLFLIDDLGYRDVGAYNPDTFYETPAIDARARGGMRFTDGYAEDGPLPWMPVGAGSLSSPTARLSDEIAPACPVTACAPHRRATQHALAPPGSLWGPAADPVQGERQQP